MRIETIEQFAEWEERGERAVYLVDRDGEPAVALVWEDEDGEWHGLRPVTEDDGPWTDLPEAVRATLGVRVDGFDPYQAAGDSFVPFTVLWPLTPSTGIDLIAAERRRQVTEEGYSPEHDADHPVEDLARAAAVYATPPPLRTHQDVWGRWPWLPEDWKPSPDDRVRELTKAGALIAAELDRIIAAGPVSGEGGGSL